MATLNPYLTFDGTCREAMTFYHQCLGGELFVQTFGEAPMESTPESKDRIMHASVSSNGIVIMASDCQPGDTLTVGNNFSMSINCDSREHQDKLWAGLSAGGTQIMELQDTFWGARFGMFTDKFGIGWMLNFETAKQASN